jgi:hypothetical protein
MEAITENGESLRNFSDAFVTFLYAASVHLIIAHFVKPSSVTTLRSLAVLLLILFIFSDWLSRMRLPRLLPAGDTFSFGSQLLKTTLEVSGLFFLVLAWLAIVEGFTPEPAQPTMPLRPGMWSEPLTPARAFALFLIATFFWNLLMLLVMKKLRWRDLALMGIDGSALQSDKVKPYAKRFWQFWEELEKTTRAASEQGSHNALRNFMRAQPVLFFEAFVRAGAQIVVNHIAWTNIWAGCLILLPWFYPGSRTLASMVSAEAQRLHSSSATAPTLVVLAASQFLIILFAIKSHGWLVILFHVGTTAALLGALVSSTLFMAVLLFAVPTLLFYFGCCCPDSGAGARVLRCAAGSLGTILLLLNYFVLEPYMLMFLVAVQQVCVNIFLQYAASNKVPRSREYQLAV